MASWHTDTSSSAQLLSARAARLKCSPSLLGLHGNSFYALQCFAYVPPACLPTGTGESAATRSADEAWPAKATSFREPHVMQRKAY